LKLVGNLELFLQVGGQTSEFEIGTQDVSWKKKIKPQTTLENVILRDSKEPILEHYQGRGEMINIAGCSDELKPSIRGKRRGQLLRKVVLYEPILLSTLLKHSAGTLSDLRASPIQIGPCSVRMWSFQIPQSFFTSPTFYVYLWPRAVRDSTTVAWRSVENLSFWGHTRAFAALDQTYRTQRDRVDGPTLIL
jgi:hypothetical protein